MPLAKLLLWSVAILFAAQIQIAAAADLTPGLKAEIDRFAQMHSGITPEASKAPVANLPLSMLAPGARLDLPARGWWADSKPTTMCAIPLREMRIDHPERFASRAAEFPGTRDPMPRAKVPAPVCDAKFLASLR
jgi:hypothetical protein